MNRLSFARKGATGWALLLIQLFSFGTISTAQCFSQLSISGDNVHQIVSFQVSKEENIFEYRLEGGTDSLNLELLTTHKCAGNSVLGRNYTLDLYDSPDTYFRISALHMDRTIVYSPVVSTSAPKPEIRRERTRPVTFPTKVIAARKATNG